MGQAQYREAVSELFGLQAAPDGTRLASALRPN
jgi:hypothetical protein